VRRPSPIRAFLWWSGLFSAGIEGFWVLSTIYAITEVGLDPFQLVMLGTALEIAVLVSEIPTGVVADAVSRKWSVVISMFIMAVGFILTGISDSFWPILIAQVIWGFGWTFTSGANTAWISDELLHAGEPQAAVDKAVTSGARAWHLGGILGLVIFGLLGFFGEVSTAIVLSGVWTIALGLWIAWAWEEHGFKRVREKKLANSIRIFKNGLALARADQMILTVLAVTVLFNFGAEAVDRLTDKRLIDIGIPRAEEPVVFITGLAILGWLLGAALLHWAERRIERPGEGRRLYISLALLAAMGTVLIATAPSLGPGAVGSLMVRGLAWSVLPVVAEVWVNRQAESESRATVQSFLGQAESIGEIGGGIVLGLVARRFNIPIAMYGSALLFAASAIFVWRSRSGAKLAVS
jgi:MFS family permease